MVWTNVVQEYLQVQNYLFYENGTKIQLVENLRPEKFILRNF